MRMLGAETMAHVAVRYVHANPLADLGESRSGSLHCMNWGHPNTDPNIRLSSSRI